MPAYAILRRPEAFQRVLQRRALLRSAHFALHHAATPENALCPPSDAKLSTGDAPTSPPTVDEQPGAAPAQAAVWLGLVVPKRQARRAVTRNLIRRELRAGFVAWMGAPGCAGVWVLRLHRGFDRALFPSAASPALRRAVREDLARLLANSPTQALQRRRGLR